MIKNWIIGILSVFLLFFVLKSLFFFDYENAFDRDYIYEKKALRIDKVNSSNYLKFAVVYNPNDIFELRAVESIKKNINIINSKGGLNSKKIVLVERKVSASVPEYLAEVQDVCTPPDVAVCLGPFHAAHIKSTRALTHFAGVPLLSSLSVYLDNLPFLENNNFATIIPSIKRLSNVILSHMNEHNISNVLIISPEITDYGGMISSELESQGHVNDKIKSFYRVNYNGIFKYEKIHAMIKIYLQNHKIDAVFFTGAYNELSELFELFNEFPTVPRVIYGTEVLNNPNIKQKNYDYTINAISINMNTPIVKKLIAYNIVENNDFAGILGSESIILIKEYFDKNKKYNPDELVNFYLKRSRIIEQNESIISVINLGARKQKVN
ncbi:MAG: hypothetical protein ACI4V7_01045 [Succinivibrionaceae bacterium]